MHDENPCDNSENSYIVMLCLYLSQELQRDNLHKTSSHRVGRK